MRLNRNTRIGLGLIAGALLLLLAVKLIGPAQDAYYRIAKWLTPIPTYVKAPAKKPAVKTGAGGRIAKKESVGVKRHRFAKSSVRRHYRHHAARSFAGTPQLASLVVDERLTARYPYGGLEWKAWRETYMLPWNRSVVKAIENRPVAPANDEPPLPPTPDPGLPPVDEPTRLAQLPAEPGLPPVDAPTDVVTQMGAERIHPAVTTADTDITDLPEQAYQPSLTVPDVSSAATASAAEKQEVKVVAQAPIVISDDTSAPHSQVAATVTPNAEKAPAVAQAPTAEQAPVAAQPIVLSDGDDVGASATT